MTTVIAQDPQATVTVQVPGTVTIVEQRTTVAVIEDTAIVQALDQPVTVQALPNVTVQVGSTAVAVIDAAVQGPAGPQGPPGPAGGAPFIWDQPVPAATWTIPHNLGRYPAAVTVQDTTHRTLLVAISYPSVNTVVVQMNAANAGTAYIE